MRCNSMHLARTKQNIFMVSLLNPSVHHPSLPVNGSCSWNPCDAEKYVNHAGPTVKYPEASTFQHSSRPRSSFYLSSVKVNISLSLPKQPSQCAARNSWVTKLTNSFCTQLSLLQLQQLHLFRPAGSSLLIKDRSLPTWLRRPRRLPGSTSRLLCYHRNKQRPPPESQLL